MPAILSLAILLLPSLALAQAGPAPVAKPAHTVPYFADFDLDGDGAPDPVALEYMGADGCVEVRLVAGRHRARPAKPIQVYLSGPPTRATVELHRTDLDPRRPGGALYIDKLQGCDTEYFNATDLLYGQWRAFMFALEAGELRQIWSLEGHDPRVTVRGDGSWEYEQIKCVRDARYRESGETGWEGRTPVVTRWGLERRTLLRMRYRDGRVTVTRPRTRTLRSKCMASGRFCPFVYVGEPPALIGEILRDQVGAADWAEDQLPVAHTPGQVLTLHLIERKPGETTRLDAIWVAVDGQIFRPIGCFEQPWCVADGQLHSMGFGDTLILRFGPLPAGDASVHAVGYYDADALLAATQRALIGGVGGRPRGLDR